MKPSTLFLFVSVAILASCETRRPLLYEIPKGYNGWVQVEYRNPACPPLKRQEGFYVVRISDSGDACTSNSFEEGAARDKYYFVSDGRLAPIPISEPGGGGLIWGESFSVAGDGREVGRSYLRFFVGTESDYRKQTASGVSGARARCAPELNPFLIWPRPAGDVAFVAGELEHAAVDRAAGAGPGANLGASEGGAPPIPGTVIGAVAGAFVGAGVGGNMGAEVAGDLYDKIANHSWN